MTVQYTISKHSNHDNDEIKDVPAMSPKVPKVVKPLETQLQHKDGQEKVIKAFKKPSVSQSLRKKKS
jgi:hypothetical protein